MFGLPSVSPVLVDRCGLVSDCCEPWLLPVTVCSSCVVVSVTVVCVELRKLSVWAAAGVTSETVLEVVLAWAVAGVTVVGCVDVCCSRRPRRPSP